MEWIALIAAGLCEVLGVIALRRVTLHRSLGSYVFSLLAWLQFPAADVCDEFYFHGNRLCDLDGNGDGRQHAAGDVCVRRTEGMASYVLHRFNSRFSHRT